MERAAGLTHDDTTLAKLDKLDAMLAQTSTSKQVAALFAEMLSTTGVIQRSIWNHNSAGRKRWKRSPPKWRHCRDKAPC